MLLLQDAFSASCVRFFRRTFTLLFYVPLALFVRAAPFPRGDADSSWSSKRQHVDDGGMMSLPTQLTATAASSLGGGINPDLTCAGGGIGGGSGGGGGDGGDGAGGGESESVTAVAAGSPSSTVGAAS